VWVSSVSIGGVELELEDVLADVVIRHGRGSYDEPPTASTVQLRLRGVDRELSGPFTVGVPIVVSIDEGVPRFTGTVTDAALDDDELTVIGAGPLSTLSRYTIGADPWPAERWHERVLRAFSEAGVPELVALEFVSDWDPELAARGSAEAPPDPVTLLDYLTLLADDLGAAIVDTPDGHVLVQELSARAQTATLTWETTPPTISWTDGACTWEDATSLGALDPSYPVRGALVVDPADVLYVPAWEQTLDVENETTVGYGDQLTVTVDEPASAALYGPLSGSLSTQLEHVADATTRAQERVGRLAFPRWIITAAHLLRGYPELAIGQPVELSDFPPSSPFESWRPILEGWTDTIDGELWTTDLALSDPLLSGVVLLWVTTPLELAWEDADPACDWKDATSVDALTPARTKEAVHA
jgi:hypothetical protein